MTEVIRTFDIKMEVDTNKRTITRHAQPESITEAIQFLRNMADELEEEIEYPQDLHRIQCDDPHPHDAHSWVMVKPTHHSRYYCLGVKS